MSVVRRCSAGAVVAGMVLLGGPAWAQEDPCAGSRPVEPGDGEVSEDEGIAEGEPAPEEPVEGEPEPGPDEPVSSEPEPKPAETLVAEEPPPGAVGDDGVMCAFDAPVSGPAESAPVEESTAVDGVAAQLPRTGPQDRLLALAAVGSGMLVIGAGAVAAGGRRRSQV